METHEHINQGEPSESLSAGALVVARRFSAGATMWVVAPELATHGRHVAVEFVHPVIVGKRALPAIHVEARDSAGSLRLLARPGDLLVALGGCDQTGILDLMRRSDAWGLTRIWLGAGPRPPSDCADQLIWLDRSDLGAASCSGDLVMLYHLLWELTHVVFEHPGLLEPVTSDAFEVCITCSDEGRVAEVTLVRDFATVEVISAGRAETIDASLIDPVVPGDLVLVHAGVALTTLAGGPPK